jgi:hypothetical protein
MGARGDSIDKAGNSRSEYDDLLLIEDLESLLEELNEAGIEGSLDVDLPAEIAERAHAAGVHSTGDLRALIEKLHRQLDEGAGPA